jgi:sugar lactone lactonase YvrE
MKGNYIGKKPASYGALPQGNTGMWEIYDQGQETKDSIWAGQPWGITTAFYPNKKWVTGLIESGAGDIQFKPDGTKLYVSGPTQDYVYQFTCSTAWDITTLSYDNISFFIGTQDGSSTSIFFKPDGTKFYMLGATNKTVFQYSCATAWDVGTAFYDNKSFSVNSQETNPFGMFFKTDGTSFYVVGPINDTVYQYTCSTAWDVSTASYSGKSFFVGGQDATSGALAFKDDGTKFYIAGQTSKIIYQYSCATAWDVSTASYDSKLCRVFFDTLMGGLFFKSDGTKMFVLCQGLYRIYEFTLSTAWDISTDNVAAGGFYIGTQEGSPTDVHFKTDGTKFYIVGSANDRVYQYSCATAWDVSTGSYDSKSFAVGTQDGTPQSVVFKTDGLTFYMLGSSNDTIYQYTCSTAWDVSTATYATKSFSVTTQDTNPTELFFKSDGLTFYMIGSSSDTIYQYTCGTAWDISTASYASKSFSVTPQGEGGPTGLFFKSNGTKFYIIGSTNKLVYQYSCATAWDISTGSYDSKSYNVNTQETAPQAVVFKSDGARLYIVGSTNDTVFQYDLPLTWDVVNSGFSAKNASASLQEYELLGFTFKPDGTEFYTCGSAKNSIFQYTCSTPWDVTTASFNKVSSGAYGRMFIGAQSATTQALFFKSDGTKFYIIDSSTVIYQYSCNTAWDVSSASYDSKSFNTSAQEANPRGMCFDSTGTKVYIIGTSGNTVYQYTCATAWDISTASYDSKSFATGVISQRGVVFKTNGTKFYTVSSSTSIVYEYSCTTAWDVSTASYSGNFFSAGMQEPASQVDLSFADTGSFFYIPSTSSLASTVFQYETN